MSVKSLTNFAQRLLFRLEVLLRAVNLRHGTHDFTSHPKEVILRIFLLGKIPSTPAGFEPASIVSSGEYDNHGTTEVDPKFTTGVKISVSSGFFTRSAIRKSQSSFAHLSIVGNWHFYILFMKALTIICLIIIIIIIITIIIIFIQ